MEVYYIDESIRDFIDSLDKAARSKAAWLIILLEQYGNQIGMPYSRKVHEDIFELRAQGRQAVRIFYTFHKRKAAILHVYIKKTQKMPLNELMKAISRRGLLDNI